MTGTGPIGQTASADVRDLLPGVRRRARCLAWAYLIVAVWLAVWTLFLALSLPKENLEHHFRFTWVGFDLILVLAVYLTAHMAFRLDARVQVPATVVTTLLVVDAWFDVTTSTTRKAATEALILALLVELPAAAFSLYVAHRVGRRVRELAHIEHGTGRHPPAADRAQAHPALPSESFPAELPPENEPGGGATDRASSPRSRSFTW
jgi:hypothetical protein